MDAYVRRYPEERRGGFSSGSLMRQVALAAAVTLFFVTRPPAEDPQRAQHPFDERREVLVENTSHVVVHPPGGTEVEDVEWGASTGTVFHVEGSEGQPLAVVWIDEGSF